MYLGHQIDCQGKSNEDAVSNFPEPTSVEKVRSFLYLK